MGLKPRRPREGRPSPQDIVVDDATKWQTDPRRLYQALVGVLGAVYRVFGDDGLRTLNNCGILHRDVSLRPIDFAEVVVDGERPAVTCAECAEGDRPWSN
jgi:hypothetical protein